ncbi:hypothetical protein [Commensalibacter papalotli (ex Botero et al. 2024)]|uniref:Uncharacterized protein n=1 Tax=Commensalibacter papalotli (ex Botero et al. 2024) TaxID=2972766 RepID=A0ABM9HL89_9PROT|nr:hypothetical protein [Commensalibacter papalotli (ex Botero et al. 2024)]CAI3933562.1 unnamed protein product [Commensalibacter papalotli (ex Botero et al. 2024)]CAI3949594.1 unnamed protein product [Commensalibacter papalotli (ex Botero et al. 2024)]
MKNNNEDVFELKVPIREYILCSSAQNEDILTGIEVKTYIPTGEKDTNRLILEGNVIPSEKVATLFKSLLFELTEEEVEEYTRYLNIMRVTKGMDAAPKHRDTEIVLDSFYTLKKHLPSAIALVQKTLNSNNPHLRNVDIIEEQTKLDVFTNIQKNIDEIDKMFPLQWDINKVRFWHHDAIFLMYMIVCFGNYRLHKQSIKWIDSPIITLIQKSLELANVINVSNDAIIKAIKRYPKLSAFENFIQNNTK